jgi:hypothetical protein
MKEALILDYNLAVNQSISDVSTGLKGGDNWGHQPKVL